MKKTKNLLNRLELGWQRLVVVQCDDGDALTAQIPPNLVCEPTWYLREKNLKSPYLDQSLPNLK
jgi:hypothetical protein